MIITTTDIAKYFYINRPKGEETFTCGMEDGEIKMSPENYVTGEMKEKIYNFIKDFPYDISLYVSSAYLEFVEIFGVFRRKGLNSGMVFQMF